MHIAAAVAATWRAKFGKGPHLGRDDSVGGYMCWDWAYHFNQAIASLGLKCWTHASKMMMKLPIPKGKALGPVHYFVDVHACKNKKSQCSATIDDGWYKRGGFFHKHPFVKGGRKVRRGTMRTPPTIAP